jgi:uncharacterized protein
MQLSNRFDVPLPVEAAWPLLLDVPRMARCMPGAALTETVDERTYRGTVTVKLGPVRLDFAGEARIDELDVAARQAKVSARGNDTKGRGNAVATVTFRLAPEGEGTRVDIETDLQLVGTVAQYGRGAGLIKQIANQLVGEFAANLRRELAAPPPAEPMPAEPTPARVGEAPAAAGSERAPPPARPSGPPREAKPVAGFGLLFRTLGAMVTGWFARLFGRRPE